MVITHLTLLSLSLLILSTFAAAFTTRPFTSCRKFGVASTARNFEIMVTKEDLLGARDMIDGIIDEKNCGPILVRLGKSDV